MDGAATVAAGSGRVAFLQGLTAKQAAATLVVALLFGSLGSAAELLLDWRVQRQDLAAAMQQTLEMVRPSAAEAAYQLNDELARRVTVGLIRYATVRGVALFDDDGKVLARQQRSDANGAGGLAVWLFGDLCSYHVPLMQNARVVGRLEVELSPRLVAQGYFDRALFNAGMGLLRALAICGVVVFVFYGMITRPLVRLSQQVSEIDPRRPGVALLPLADQHKHDEVGALTDSLNALLAAFQRGLDERDRAEAELTALTLDLESRVEQRTQALARAKEEIEVLNRRLAAENQRLGGEVEVSRKLQRMILPTPEELADVPGLELAAYMDPATEVGGDYYDVLQAEDGRVCLGIGDVTGHGLESGAVMLMAQCAVRTLVTAGETDLPRLLSSLNRALYDNIRRMGSGRNLTLALLEYRREESGGRVRIAGQHETVIVMRRAGGMDLIDTADLGLPLGLVDTVGEFVAETEVILASGDGLVLYTDGITEAANTANDLYGLDRLCDVLASHWHLSAEEIRRAVIADVLDFIGEQKVFDDLTLVVVKQLPET